MGAYSAIKQTFQGEYKERSPVYRARIVKWNSEAPVVRVERPTNIARARELGYRAKQGVLIARVRVLGGKKKRQKFAGGRKPSKSGRYLSRRKSTQAIAEERASARFSNCEVLNSYFVGSAGSTQFYEVILLDRSAPAVLADERYRDIVAQRGRASRGLTSTGISHRGIASKGFGTEQFRPSKRANNRN